MHIYLIEMVKITTKYKKINKFKSCPSNFFGKYTIMSHRLKGLWKTQNFINVFEMSSFCSAGSLLYCLLMHFSKCIYEIYFIFKCRTHGVNDELALNPYFMLTKITVQLFPVFSDSKFWFLLFF